MRTKKQKYNLLLAGMIVLLAVTSFANKASATGNVTGYVTGFSDNGSGQPSYFDYASMSDVTKNDGYAYGVTIPSSDGLLSGTAYDGGLGSYIAFDNSAGYLTGCPSGTCNASRVGNALQGWARIVGIAQAGTNAGGWDGWISLSGAGYGVTIDPATGKLNGYAWAGDQGWIDFSGATVAPTAVLTICRNSCNSAPGNLASGATDTIMKGLTGTYKACYGAHGACGGDVDVTGLAATSWAAVGGGVSVANTGVVTANTISNGNTVTALYNPGTGNISSSLTVNVIAAPSCTCDAAVASNTCTTAPKFNDSCGATVCSGTKTCSSTIVTPGSWKEVAP